MEVASIHLQSLTLAIVGDMMSSVCSLFDGRASRTQLHEDLERAAHAREARPCPGAHTMPAVTHHQ